MKQSPFKMKFLKCITGSLLFLLAIQANTQNLSSNFTVSSSLNKGNREKIAFTPNKGQVADRKGKLRSDVLYQSGNIYLRKTGISYVYSNSGTAHKEIGQKIEQLKNSPDGLGEKTKEELEQELYEKAKIGIQQIDVDFIGCNNNITTINEGIEEGFLNFYYAHCPNGIMGVNQYEQITYKNLYNNIDVRYYGNPENGLEYDLIVHPHADPKQIQMQYIGADNLEVINNRLQITTFLGKIEEYMPEVYQNIEGKRVAVAARYVLTSSSSEKKSEGLVTFDIAQYNSNYALIIDPWVTYYGGQGWDQANSVVTDVSGNVYIAGVTDNSTTSIASGGFQNSYGGGQDAFLVKFNEAGMRIWATYYGGTELDIAHSVATDVAGNVYIAGGTKSPTGIASGGFQNVSGGANDAFLVKFNGGTGNRIWATYYGGTDFDVAKGVATDDVGNVYITGDTKSATAIFFGGFQNVFNGSQFSTDAFLVKFNAGTGNRIWATYYGGNRPDIATSVVADAAGNVYIAGNTRSLTDIASGGFQNVLGGNKDAFLVKFNAGTGNRIWATYYGGNRDDEVNGVAADAVGNVYIAGKTNSTTAIASVGLQNGYAGGFSDGFLVKFNGGTGNRIWATYLGGSGWDYLNSVAVDLNTNHVYVSGDTYSTDFLMSPCALQPNHIGLENGFLARFYPNGDLFCSSYFGNLHEEDTKIAVHGCYIYLAGHSSGGVPTTSGAHQTNYGGITDGFLAQLYKSSCGITTGLTTTLTKVDNSSCGVCNGEATVKALVSCNIDTVDYIWSTGVTKLNSIDSTDNLTGLCEGNYWVKVFHHCTGITDSIAFVITTTAVCGCTNPPVLAITTQTDESCSSGNGSATVEVAAGTGTAPFVYAWNTTPVQTGTTATGLSAGTYQVIVTDNITGCAGTLDVVINNNTLTVSKQQGVANCPGCSCKEWAMINATSGTAPFSYSWSDGYNGRYKNKVCTGNYDVTVTDSAGCVEVVSVSVP